MAGMTAPKPLQIFKPGRHTAMSGASLDFSAADLAASAAAYDPAKHEAPIVVGHPRLDAPAYGWVSRLKAGAGGLEAEPHQVDPAFADMVTDRAPTGNIVVQGGLIAEKDWYSLAKNATLAPVSITHGNVAGSRFRLAMPATQLKAPKIDNKNGVVAYGMDLRAIPVNGNDEVFFIFD